MPRQKKYNREEKKYYPILKKLIEDIGDWNVNYYSLSKEWGIPNQNIYRWKNKILIEIELPDVYKMGKNTEVALYSAIRQCQLKIKSVDNESDRIGYMNALVRLSEGLTRIQESYGRKQQLRFDSLEQEVQINQVQIIQNVVKEMEERKIETNARTTK
jgi:hypothetical protein